MVFGGTSWVTTELAPTMELSPMVTPGSTVDAISIHTFLPMVIGAPYVQFLFVGSAGWLIVIRFTFGAMNVLSPIVMPQRSKNVQHYCMSTFFPTLRFFPKSM